MKCVTTMDLSCDVHCPPELISVVNGRKVIKSGTLIDQDVFPITDCVRLVQSGQGVPADDECREACRMTQAQIDAAQAAIKRMYAMPEDESDDPEDDHQEDDE